MASERTNPEQTEGLHEFIAIGIAGPLGSGKSSIGQTLENHFGFAHITVSDMLKSLAKAQGIKPPFSRELLSDIYSKLVDQEGEAPATHLAEELIATYRAMKSIDGATIDGIRHPEEVEHFKTFKNSYLIMVNAEPSVRFERIVHRERTGDITSWEEFKKRSNMEVERLVPMYEMADYVIDNNGSQNDMEQQLLHFVFEKTKLF